MLPLPDGTSSSIAVSKDQVIVEDVTSLRALATYIRHIYD